MLTEAGWTIVGAPWHGQDVVYDLLARHEGRTWALRLLDMPDLPNTASDMLGADLLSEGSADCGLVIGQAETRYVGLNVSFDEDHAMQLVHMTREALAVSYHL
jgi:hypothetical protein